MNRLGSLPDNVPDEFNVIGKDDEQHPRRVLIENIDDSDTDYIVGELKGKRNVLLEDRSWFFRKEKWAKLCFGVVLKNVNNSTSVFDISTISVIPVNIATSGPQAIASYLGCLYRRLELVDELNFDSPRKAVASRMDYTEQTVSNCWNSVRWDE